ncbi:short chain dehydrogenase reductase family oxidoreductase like protein [Zymoseptoria brevis]|uniref:Short chain dehydrogenase reductase family oxidoreductase like protein n=1 Tax=Zymoseptoria brevis TaxID=1047168 RepID=A0A0F4G661_9PEZI|nr:short chain dehydrogenase reductase family oxidoreductase like protein [Zymoseptoria brevis]
MAELLIGTAFITGAASGLGRATAFAFAQHGITNLALTDLDPTALENTRSDLIQKFPRLNVLVLVSDVRSEDAVARAIADTVSQFGRIDAAVNNAGISGGSFALTQDASWEDWSRIYDVNIHGVWRCQKYELKQMSGQEVIETKPGQPLSKSRGVIINVASVLGLLGGNATTPVAGYSSTKHAVLGLTKTDAICYATQGIRVNAICPGYIDTPLLQNLDEATLQRIVSKIPAGRLGNPEEIGNAIVFLASYLSSFMTGQVLVVDGGQLAG